MKVTISINSDKEFDNAYKAANVLRSHPELSDPEEVLVVAEHRGGDITDA